MIPSKNTILISLLALSGTLLPGADAAYYPPASSTVPVQSAAQMYPGYTCNYWSPVTGECMDFSYFKAPTHVAAPRRVTTRPRCTCDRYGACRCTTLGTTARGYGYVTVRVSGHPGTALPRDSALPIKAINHRSLPSGTSMNNGRKIPAPTAATASATRAGSKAAGRAVPTSAARSAFRYTVVRTVDRTAACTET